MKIYWVAFLFLLGGCLTSNGLQYEAVSETNQYRLARVRKGMSQKQVLQVMHKPYSYESFEFDDDIYDVWFYVTRPTGLDQSRMVPQNLTPLTFRNGTLVGRGYYWYYYAMKEQAHEASLQSPAEKKTSKENGAEDKAFEKTLKSTLKPEPEKGATEEQKLPPNVHIISENEPLKSEKGGTEEQKLPPNVHIISENEPLNCEICPPKECAPNRFVILQKGMKETQVFRLFGKPLKHESFTLCENHYDIWIYDTIASKTNKPSIVPQHQTILTFKNAVLMSMDDETYYELKSQLPKEEVSAVQPPQSVRVPQQKQRSSTFKPYFPKGAPLGMISQDLLSKVKKGMSESQVLEILGTTADQDTFMIKKDVYDIWYYKMDPNGASIPLTFRNGVLIGKSAREYHRIKKKKGGEKCDDCYDERGERLQKNESDQNFDYW